MQLNEKRSKIPYIFFAFFAVIILVNIFYIYLSNVTWRGVATEDAYQKGLNYNDTINASKKQNSLGWKVNEKYQRVSATKGNMLIELLDKNSQVIRDADVQVTFKRPTQEGFDFVVKFNSVDGVYKSEITFPMKGQWESELLITKGADSFKEVKRHIIQ